MKEFYQQSIDQVLKETSSQLEGLSNQEALNRLETNGPNALSVEKETPLIIKFINQFKDIMIIILLVAAFISAFISHEMIDSIVILLVVLINAGVGLIQDNKSSKAILALKKLSSPHANVLRDNQVVNINASDIVVGDIVLLEAGDIIPADLRLIQSNSLQIEESALTGESVPVDKDIDVISKKDVALGDQSNLAFSSTYVTYGSGKGIVIAIGMDTEVGHIATMIEDTTEQTTPLKQNLNHLGKILSVGIIIIVIVMFLFGILINQTPWMHMLITSISLAVAAIPEGLLAIVTIILALGMQQLAQKKSIIKKLYAVETLGCVDVICSDKTGTLTQNKMSVEKIYLPNQIYDVKDFNDDISNIYKIINYANNTKIDENKNLLGDPTETALIQFSLNKNHYSLDNERVKELPFDSTRKLMSTINQDNQHYTVYTKGAIDVLLDKVTKIEIDGKIRPINSEDITSIQEATSTMASHALRVLGFAYKPIESIEDTSFDIIENDLIFVGLVGMIDPERPEAKDAIIQARRAGIDIVMITGDHKDTAYAIAKRLGIIENHQQIITGAQLNQISDEDFIKEVNNYKVYARVSPEHKVRIVKAWQANNKTVAMTGDGVNDAPSLKQADIGIGMGITGTEVSKNASEMILTDDNFTTIIDAVKEGRKIFSNIQKSIQYLLASNIAEVLVLFIATLLGWSTLLPIHLLWINLVTDTLPAITLGLEPVQDSIMDEKPRGKDSSFFSGGILSNIIYQGIIQAIIVLLVYTYAVRFPEHSDTSLIHADALTMTFITLGLLQLFNSFNVKSSRQSIFKIGVFKNKFYNIGIIISFILLLMTIVLPKFDVIFRVTHLDLHQWLVVVLAGISIIPIVEIIKYIQRKQS